MYLLATEAQQENPVILSLDAEIGSRGPIRLLSLWKRCCFGYLVQANMLDPVALNFSALSLIGLRLLNNRKHGMNGCIIMIR